MQKAAGMVPVTVKCRIGVDDQEPREVLPAFIETMRRGGGAAGANSCAQSVVGGAEPQTKP